METAQKMRATVTLGNFEQNYFFARPTVDLAIQSYHLDRRFQSGNQRDDKSAALLTSDDSNLDDKNLEPLNNLHIGFLFVACIFAAPRRHLYNAMTLSMSFTMLKSLTDESKNFFEKRLNWFGVGSSLNNTVYRSLCTTYCSVITFCATITVVLLAFPSLLWSQGRAGVTLTNRFEVFLNSIDYSIGSALAICCNLVISAVVLPPTLALGIGLAVVNFLEAIVMTIPSRLLLPSQKSLAEKTTGKSTVTFNPLKFFREVRDDYFMVVNQVRDDYLNVVKEVLWQRTPAHLVIVPLSV